MLKFFRIYNKYILAVGATLLMVAFLIQPVISMFQPSPDSQVIGTLHGEKVRRGEITPAAVELQVLGRLFPQLQTILGTNAKRWMLLVREAERLGLSASRMEVDELLRIIGADEAVQNRVANSVSGTSSFVKQAVRHWIMVETYRQLVLGETHMKSQNRLTTLSGSAQQYGLGMVSFFANHIGTQRLSEPLLRHYIVDQQARVAGKVVMVPASQVMDEIDDPSKNELQALFEKHANDIPGRVLPYGFGYRMPPRLKLETFTIDFQDVAKSIVVDEVDAMAYFEQHQDQYVDAEDKPQAYSDVREQVIQQLRDEKTNDKIIQIISRARAILLDAPAYRALATQDGYKVIPDDYQPMSFRIVADEIEQSEQYTGIAPKVAYHREDWINIQDLIELEGIGYSSLADRGDVFLPYYVMSAREMQPGKDNPLVGLRLQTKVASRPMRSLEGSRHLFRLIDAQPEQAPASLDLVREQVIADARQLTAYNMLAEDTDAWAKKASDLGLHRLAGEVDTDELELKDVSRSTRGPGSDSAPTLPGVGSDDSFIEAIFELANTFVDRTEPITDLPIAERVVAVPIDGQLAVAVFRLDDYTPMTQAAYEKESQKGKWLNQASFSLVVSDLQDPLTYDAVVKRIGYESAFGDDDEEDVETDSDEPEADAE